MKYIKIILSIIASLLIFGCGDTPIFTEMSTSRLKVVIKGTLETEGRTYLSSMPADSRSIEDDSVDNVTNNDVLAGGADTPPSVFMFDIAELRLDGKKFANYRQVIQASLLGDGSSESFFNGDGVELVNDDPAEGHYDTVQVYIRKMIFDNAMVYQSAGDTLTYEKPAEVIFHENDTEGFDFNQLQVNSYRDGLRIESGEILRNFPIEVPIIGGLDYYKDNPETILEIRFVVKNFIKKYEYDYYDSGVFKVCHYYAFSDWLRDIRAGERDIGRNIQAVARVYVPSKTGQVTISAGLGNYVVAIPSSEVITDYGLTLVGSTLRDNNACDLPQTPSYPGAYIEAVLDYYLKYEKYKNDFNTALGSCTDFLTYETAWETYEAAVDNFKIPPYVSYSTGSVTFSNMAPGVYNFYQIPAPAYGNLFLSGDFIPIAGNPRTINVGAN